jgi:LPXTG-site transpeptidase (sortase) family protein
MVIVFSRKRKIAKHHLGNAGRGLTLGALLILLLVVFLPIILGRQEAKVRLRALNSNVVTFNDLLRLDMQNALKVNQATYFSLEIPKIEAFSQVIANVNTSDQKTYSEALKKGIAHAAGTYLPGMGGSVTFFAHSTDIAANITTYNALFYRLDELAPGDLVNVWFLGEKLTYRVRGSKITPPDDVSVFIKEQSGEKLDLVTCTPRGTTKNRLIVEAELI